MRDVRLGAEAAAADPDAVLVAEDGGERSVLDAVDGERHDADAVDASTSGACRWTPGSAPSRAVTCRTRRRSWSATRSRPTASQSLDGRRQRHRAEDVRAAALLPIGQLGPAHVVERDGLDRPAAGDGAAWGGTRRAARSARRCRTARTPCAPESATKSRCPGSSCGRRSIGRWAASWAASTMMSPPTACTRSAIVVDPGHDAGHVRRAGDAQHADPTGVAGEQLVEVVLVERAVGCGPDVDDPGPLAPRQVVRVVLEHGRDDHGVVGHATTAWASMLIASVVCLPKTTVSRSGSAPTNRPTTRRAPLVGVGRVTGTCSRCPGGRWRSGAAGGHRVEHGLQRRRGRRVVEVHVRHPATVEQGHELVDADHLASVDDGWSDGGDRGAGLPALLSQGVGGVVSARCHGPTRSTRAVNRPLTRCRRGAIGNGRQAVTSSARAPASPGPSRPSRRGPPRRRRGASPAAGAAAGRPRRRRRTRGCLNRRPAPTNFLARGSP